jgi:hypothetical protein
MSDEISAACNGEMLDILANQQHAYNPLKGLKHGEYLDWDIAKITKKVNLGGQPVEQVFEKPVLCVRDKDGTKVDLSASNHYAKSGDHAMTIMMPYAPVRLWESTISSIMEANGGKLTAKDRQTMSLQSNDTPEVRAVFKELLTLSSQRLAKCLANWTTEDGAKISNNVEKVEEMIEDDHNARIYKMVRNPEDYPASFKVKKFLFPYAPKGKGGVPSSFPGTDFDELSEDDQERIMDVIKSANGTKTYGGVRLVLPDGSIGSVSKLNQAAKCAAVVKIHGLETKSGKGGWSVVSNLESLILAPYGNGPPSGGMSAPPPSFNAFEMLENTMKKRKEPIKSEEDSTESSDKASNKAKLLAKRRKKHHSSGNEQ